MNISVDMIYNLLPAIYRIRDSEDGLQLQALIEIIAAQAKLLENDITNLYENWFIETCDEWVVPYIGDLIAVKGLHSFNNAAEFSNRARVANTISYRRRKGTATMLEQLAYDTTGWRSRVAEFFLLLETTEYYNHIRIKNLRTPDLRLTNQLELIDTPFDTAAHTGEVRNIINNRGYYNISNVGIYLWRIQSYFIEKCSARSAGDVPDGRYTISQLGNDLHLFNRPQTETEITSIAQEINVPGLLRRRPLYDELESRRQALVDNPSELRDALINLREAFINGLPYNNELNDLSGVISIGGTVLFDDLKEMIQNLLDGIIQVPDALEIIFEALTSDYIMDEIYFGSQPVFQIFVQNKNNTPIYELLAEEIMICNLSEIAPAIPEIWRRPPEHKSYAPADGSPPKSVNIKASVDTVFGRIAFPVNIKPEKVLVSYAYGFSGDLGGGPYNRSDLILPEITRQPDWQVIVSKEIPTEAGKIFSSLTDAINEWNNLPGGDFGIITIIDNYTYGEDISSVEINISSDSKLIITGSRWNEVEIDKVKKRIPGKIEPEGIRPHINSDIVVRGTSEQNDPLPGEIIFDGLLIEGSLNIKSESNQQLGSLKIYHCTLVPDKGGIMIASSNESLTMMIKRTICGPVQIENTTLGSDVIISKLEIEESIINGKNDEAISADSVDLEIEKCTIFGDTKCRTIIAGNSIFTGSVDAKLLQTGCARFSYIPPGSNTPRRFKCQPDLVLQKSAKEIEDYIISSLVPGFSSEIYGIYNYLQLSKGCPAEIKTGAEDGSEMGTFSFLKQPQREANLRTSLNEYLRFGLQTGLIFVT